MKTYGEQRAINEISSLLAGQWSNGMIPQIKFTPGQTGYHPDVNEWGVLREVSGNPNYDTSGITQPPNPALALWRIYEHSEHKDSLIEDLDIMYEGIKIQLIFIFINFMAFLNMSSID